MKKGPVTENPSTVQSTAENFTPTFSSYLFITLAKIRLENARPSDIWHLRTFCEHIDWDEKYPLRDRKDLQ